MADKGTKLQCKQEYNYRVNGKTICCEQGKWQDFRFRRCRLIIFCIFAESPIMKLLIKNAQILDSRSEYHLQKKDLLIENGIFTKIAATIEEPADRIISTKNLCISTGFTDLFSNFNDPGFEQKETLVTGAFAAQKGGFTTVFIVPNTQPCIDSKTSIEYIRQQSKNLPVQIIPMGAVTRNTEGKSLSEMIEMHQAGAVAFTDGLHPVQDSGVLLKALQYIKMFNGTIIQVPTDRTLGAHGMVNEGILSTQLGLPGIPAIAEEIMVTRDIEICSYTQSRLHITGISTAKSLSLIQQAKENNIPVTCSVTPYHLFFDESEINNYNTNAKVNPPLRTKNDMLALQQGLKDGIIDCVAAHHFPQEPDAKLCEFGEAQFGMSTIEYSFHAVAAIDGMTPETIARVFSSNCKQIFNLPEIKIAEQAVCDATLFCMEPDMEPGVSQLISKGKNSLFNSRKLKGKIIATLRQTHNYIAE
jgi:dihydroorotase